MRQGTKVVLAIRNVGAKDSEKYLEVVHAPLGECIRHLIQYLKDNPLIKRFDIAIGRDEEDCRKRLLLEGRTPKTEGMSDTERAFMDLFNETEGLDA